jgi:hypothetical protein
MGLFTVDCTVQSTVKCIKTTKKQKEKLKGISRELLRKKFNINKLN